MLARGVGDRRSAFHTPMVATVGLDGAPKVRTVVLRAVDVGARTLRFHTDCRSEKAGEITANPQMAIIGYDAGHKIQLRLSGRATLHFGAGDALAEQAWAATPDRSRVGYRQAVGPGAALATGAIEAAPLPDGFEHFIAVSFAVNSIEWLYLAHGGHRRARFTWRDGAQSSTWLAP